MESSLDLPERSALEDPQRLTVALEQSGWQYAGGRRGEYARLREPGEGNPRHTQSIIIPLDTEADEYREDMLAILQLLSSGTWMDAWIRQISPKLSLGTMDVIRLRKEVGTPSGLIPWRVGEDFVLNSRNILMAGAKTYMAKERQFRNRFGQFANRFLDTVMMGQTEPGSYILSAYTPTSEEVPLRSVSAESIGIPNIDFVYTRDVMNAIVTSLDAVSEALEHYRRRSSMSGFSDGVRRGVSYELTKSLSLIAANADESDITFELSRSSDRGSPEVVRREFLFRPSDSGVLNRASVRLLEEDSMRTKATIIGKVHLLSRRESEEPGTVGIEVWSGADINKVRVKVDSNQEYHDAIVAHDNETPVIVTGNLEREGNLWRMYNAALNPYQYQEHAEKHVERDDLMLDLPFDLPEEGDGHGAVS